MSSMSVSDIVVIGAGIAGAGAAFRLADRGFKPVVVERAFPAAGPTGKSSAITHAFYMLPALSQLAIRGCEILRRIPELTGAAPCVSEVGMMWVMNEAARPAWADAVKRIQGEGARIETLPVDEFARRAPGFTLDRIAMAVWEPDYGYADPHGATTALIDGARQRGARVLNNSIAQRIHVSNGKVSGVELSNGERIACDRVVVAVGVWSRRFFLKHGIDLPVTIERHPMAVLDAPGRARDIMPWAWCDDAMLHYGRPDGDSRVLLGTWAGGGTGVRHNEQKRPRGVADPDDYDEVVDLDESSDILSWALPRIPGIAELGIRKGYAGLYDMSPDDNPIIDAVPGIEGAYLACGSSGHGFKLGPAVGEALADWAVGEKRPQLDAFPLARFKGA
jgi:sarcosine oxidase subunit beta